MIQPTPRALVLAAAAVPVALLPVLVHPRLWTVWLVVAAAELLAVGLDAALAAAPDRIRVEVATPPAIAVGEPGEAVVRLSSGRPLPALEVLLELHGDLAAQPPRAAAAAAGGGFEARFPLVARRRGHPTVDEVWYRFTGPLGLARRVVRRPVGREVAVTPSLGPVREAALRFLAQHAAGVGTHAERLPGEGSELDALREWVPGLDSRAIDWKASARHRKLVSREFRAERDRQVILALDTGHLMEEPLAGAPRLDHAITSALLLGYVGLRLGDRVGLFAFDRAVRAWSEPQAGVGSFARLKAASAALDYTHDETNFTLGLAELATRVRRRSLVVVFTDFVDTTTAELMVENLSRLARRQLVVFVALRDPGVDALARRRPDRLSDLYRAVVASDLLRERERVLARLRRHGIHCIDAEPRTASARLVARYLEVKRRELV